MSNDGPSKLLRKNVCKTLEPLIIIIDNITTNLYQAINS